jgi:hypothetical protein
MPKKLTLICLINFFIAALMGLVLRYSFIANMGFNYRFLTHAHSHIAMLGWVYLMLFVLIVQYFLPEKKPIYNRLFWVTQCSVIGMMFSFPFQGYATVSIMFSTLHIFCSYYFVYLIWKHHKIQNKASQYLLKTALVFMVVSTFGVWCLGPAISMLGQASAFYQIAIQFFLHFQFNGWFLIAVLALFFHLLNIENSKLFQQFYWLLIVSILLTFALPIQWFVPHTSLLWINGFGVVIQYFALYRCFKIIQPKLKFLKQNENKLVFYMYGFAIVSFFLKVVVQSLSLLPEFSQVVYQHRNFVIGFIHLMMLGIITGFLFGFILQNRWVTFNGGLTFGVYTFTLGFVLTELLLIFQGGMFYFNKGMLPNYYFLLFFCSTLLPLGIGSISVNVLKTKTNE